MTAPARAYAGDWRAVDGDDLASYVADRAAGDRGCRAASRFDATVSAADPRSRYAPVAALDSGAAVERWRRFREARYLDAKRAMRCSPRERG